jgi:hypothetical protein
MTITIGIDIGSGAVKTTLFRTDGGKQEWLAKRCERIRRRDPMTLARQGFDAVLADAGLAANDIAYIATTGEGENVKFATGHFYSMTTHARGGVFLEPSARAVVDIGALNGRAIHSGPFCPWRKSTDLTAPEPMSRPMVYVMSCSFMRVLRPTCLLRPRLARRRWRRLARRCRSNRGRC